jgi:hypothetical protein
MTPSYLIAHRALPIQAGSRPAGLWEDLSGPGWSTWLAMIGMHFEIEVRHIGVHDATIGKAVIRRDGVELIAMYFPTPAAVGEPYFGILARRVGETALRSFVFEKGSPTPEEPVQVVMAEWTFRDAANAQRLRFDATPDTSLEACLDRVVAEITTAPAAAARPVAKPAGKPVAKPGSSALGWLVIVGIAVVIGAFLLLASLVRP